MADTSPHYRIWRSPESVLIQTGAVSIELSIADALVLVADLTERLTRSEHAKRVKWTETLLAEVARLYREGLSVLRIARQIGTSCGSVDRALKKSGVTKRASHTTVSLIAARAARAAKRPTAA